MSYTLPEDVINTLKAGLHPTISVLKFLVTKEEADEGVKISLEEAVAKTDNYTPKQVAFTVDKETAEQFEDKSQVKFNTSDWSLVKQGRSEGKQRTRSSSRGTGCGLSFASKLTNKF